jgi:saccharopine dehydrogenase-like NADP-dependent oxidoreductase
MRILVLGYGQIGQVVAHDLASSGFDVTAADRVFQPVIHDSIKQVTVEDLHDVTKIIKPYDIIVGALPGSMGYDVLRQIVEAGKKYVDVSFMPEDPRCLNYKAKDTGSICMFDMGLGPGIPNMFMAWAATQTPHPRSAVYYVGGNPIKPFGPTRYLSSWSTEGVVQEYLMMARTLSDGQVIRHSALSELCEMDRKEFPGRLEAFRTDGLRSLLTTKPFPNIEEFTLRWPGHAKIMVALREMGFFDDDQIDATTETLDRHWKAAAHKYDHRDFVCLSVECYGWTDEDTIRGNVLTLYDEYDEETNTTAMARTTAFTTTFGVHLLAEDIITAPGVYAPEELGPDTIHMLRDHLASRGVNLNYAQPNPRISS